ncbi:MAG: M14 family zinc carboxypeptidase [Longimicrobiales bacterium]
MILTLAVALVLALIAAPVAAQHALADGGPYDPAVPTPASVLGYELGSQFTPHHMIVRYISAVADASPRVRLDTAGHTYEGREVLLAVVTSEANQGRLDEIQAGARLLADPRGASGDALDRAVASTPTIAWLGYTIHGNEASGVEAALGTLYELAAGQDQATRMVLDSVVVLIDPVQNPDGHERHTQDVMRDRGAFGPDPYPASMINTGGWPGARTSHYLFDLNRDWFIHSHPTTRARTGAYLEWAPHVAADLHEMGSSSTYFFAPPMPPFNPNVEASIPEWWDIFAEGNAAAMAAQGWGFFTGESFDEFYPGYGVSWPTLTGAIGMTYEQGSSSGGAVRRDDGTVLTLNEAAAHHYTASLATLRTVAARRTDRVRSYLDFRRTAITEREGADFRTVFLTPDAQGRATALVETLRSNAIEVGRLAEERQVRATPYGETDARTVRLPAGTWVVDLAQPQGRLAKAILEPEAELPAEFIEEELQARREGRRDRFYDITAWSLPFTFRVDAWWSNRVPDGVEMDVSFKRVSVTQIEEARYAYAFEPGSEASYRMLGRLLADSVRVRHAPESFRVGDADFPHGAFLVLVHRNRDRDVHALVADAARATATPVTALSTALADEGTDLGSNSVRAVPVPRVALVGGQGVSSYSFGAAWFTFDQRLEFPVTRVELSYLDRALDDFSVVVLPSAYSLGSSLGEDGVQALQRWVRGGGTLITVDRSTAWLVSSEMIRMTEREDEAEADGEPSLPASVPGAIVRTVGDTLSSLMAGVTDTEIPVMLSGSTVYAAPSGARPGEVVIRYADEDRLQLSGYLWPEVPERVADSPYLWTERMGSGRVIAFTGDPNFRALWRGLVPLFANAVFLGSTF